MFGLKMLPAPAVVEEEHTCVLRIMNTKGDEQFAWNPKKEGEVAGAKAQWDHYKAKGWIGYRVSNGGRGEVIREFDKEARQLIMAPPVQGG